MTGRRGWLDDDSPAYGGNPARGCLFALLGTLVLVIVAVVLVATGVGVAR